MGKMCVVPWDSSPWHSKEDTGEDWEKQHWFASLDILRELNGKTKIMERARRVSPGTCE